MVAPAELPAEPRRGLAGAREDQHARDRPVEAVHDAQEHRVGSGDVGPVTQRLRADLVAIQNGESPDRYGWTKKV